MLIEYDAGARGLVVSLPAGLLFQPSQTAFVPTSELRQRTGTGASFQPDRLSPVIVTPAMLPLLTSTSSSKLAADLNPLSSKRARYIVFGSHRPIVRWSRNMGR